MAELTVVVVAFHGAEKLDTCLEALEQAAPVVVVDNSSDPAVETVARRHAAAYVDAGGNLGFAAGVNLGISRAPSGRDILLLNPDAVLTAPGLRSLHEALHAPGAERIAALSPGLVDPVSGQHQQVRWPLPTPGRMWREALGMTRLRVPPLEFCVGAVLLLRAEALAQVGGFDERFFLYAEETDWQQRAIAAGWRIEELPSVIAAHEGAGTSTDPSRREVHFHAGTETYIRKWFGWSGWASYRAAAVLGALLRGLTLRGRRGAAARARAALYLRGPRSVADLPVRVSAAGRRIAHVVVTDAFAGVERYVCEVAREQAARGSVVTVIGGDPQRMPDELGSAEHRPAASVFAAARELMALGRLDVVHAHMTAADFAAVSSAMWHHGVIVSTRHFAGPRGSTFLARALGRLARLRIDQQIAISSFVAESIQEPAVVIPNGVRSQPDEQRAPRDRVVLCLNRLEPEKATDVALRAWAASGIAGDGWRLDIAGSGSQRGGLQKLGEDLGVRDSVRFLGQVSDTAALLSRASLLFAPATAEPFGLSVAEAMSYGTPVLLSRGGAHPELVGDEAWTFTPGDSKAAAGLLRQIAAMGESERRTVGNMLRDRQRRLFDLELHVAALNEIYTSPQH
ncbi:glycosyltransferase [Blastococcus sp. TF02-8]|uniref:glycosyltransferase n=1 Tax=Blastococcus sp. TF02-8 TaxID=2250574 RepID=UPI001413591C|nr:glycosyltransferase [Blastococcus sp. TF02-8]